MSDLIEKYGKYIDFLDSCRGNGNSNFPKYSFPPQDFHAGMEKPSYGSFIFFAEYHYFVARSLLVSGIFYYAFFSAQQCLELYLKAIIKKFSKKCRIGHKLSKLRTDCLKENSLPSDLRIFLESKRAATVIDFYEPYYQYPRYPAVSDFKLESHGVLIPDDIKPLDYFVYSSSAKPPALAGG